MVLENSLYLRCHGFRTESAVCNIMYFMCVAVHSSGAMHHNPLPFARYLHSLFRQCHHDRYEERGATRSADSSAEKPDNSLPE